MAATSCQSAPDGGAIAIDLLGSIWVLKYRGGDARKITPDLLEARQPTWSPDCESIAFQGYDDGAWHIYVVTRDGRDLRALTSGIFDDREPDWSHDGLRIAFSSDRGGGAYTIWQVIVATGEVGRVSPRDGVMPSWAPNDREITFFSTDATHDGANPNASPGLWGVDTEGRERLIFPTKDVGMSSPAGWSADGRQLAFTSGSRLFIGGQPVSKNEEVFPFRPQWLSRNEVLYTADGHIRRRLVMQGTAVDVPFKALVKIQRPVYSIAHRAFDASEPQRLNGIVNPVVSPDGQTVAFVAMGDVWLLPAGGRPMRLTDDEAVDLDPAWSPDGTQLAFSSDRSGQMDLWIHDFRTNADRQVTGDGGVTGAAWSPDGAHIAYLVDSRELHILNFGRDSHVFAQAATTLPGEVGRPTWSADHSTIALGMLMPFSTRFREGVNQLLLFRTETGGLSTSVIMPGHSAGNRENNGPVWSPDGLRMAFVSEGALWTVAVDAGGAALGPPTAIADDQPESPSWEGDSKHLVYLTPSGLRRVHAGGPPERIPIELSWKPSAPTGRVVVHAGKLLDGSFEALRDDTDIVVERGVIRDVTAHNPDLHTGAVVDASGEIVIPGLIEMHAHLNREYGGAFGRLWLAYGITSVRIPAVNPYDGLELHESYDAGRRIGPRVFIAGDPFDGVRVFYPGGVSITSEEQLERELERASRLGVDFFKTYVRLPDKFQKRIVDYAHAHGRPVTSHELFPAVAFGIDGVEHLRGTSRRGYSPKLSPATIAYRDVIDLIAKSGIVLTPTIGIQGGFVARATGDKALLVDPRLTLFPDTIVTMLTGLASAPPNPSLDAAVKPYELALKSIVAAGGTIVAGTDAPILPYGLSLHVELEEYVRAGMTPFQALRTATINAAAALGAADHLGRIEPGKRADLTFLGSDPLLDIRNTRDVRRVMRGGRVHTLSELTTLH